MFNTSHPQEVDHLGLTVKPIFHLATLFARREAKKSPRRSRSVPVFLCVRANIVAKWKIGLMQVICNELSF